MFIVKVSANIDHHNLKLMEFYHLWIVLSHPCCYTSEHAKMEYLVSFVFNRNLGDLGKGESFL